MSIARPFAGLVLLALSATIGPPLAAQALRNGPLPGPLPLFPPDNWWNVDVSAAPVDPDSAAFIAFYGTTVGMRSDFGGDNPGAPPHGIYGVPYATVGATQPRVVVSFEPGWPEESDHGFPGHPLGYPIPEEAKTEGKWIEGGAPGNVPPSGDRHLLIVDRDHRVLYELYRAHWNGSQWEAQSGAIYSLDSNDRRPAGWTSADAAGLAIFPGLVRYDEAFESGPIDHAFRVTFDSTAGFYVFPASHQAGNTVGALPMGARLRLKPGVEATIPSTATAAETAAVQRMVQAMKTYGLIVADNGTSGYIQGVYDTRWNNSVLNPSFGSLKLGDFEVIQLGWQPSTAQPTDDYAFHTVTPCRLLDTREPPGPRGAPPLAPPWTAAQRPGPPPAPVTPIPRVVRAAGECGISPTARAISVNLTVVGAPAPGHLTVFPGDAVAGNTSVINFGPGQTRANNAVVPLAASGSGTFGLQAVVAGGQIQVIVDVNGWFE
jgi:hypothetical protein